MINNPKILFADEPTGALNKSASDDVMKQLTKINEEGTSIMLVTHDMKVAAKCTRILYIVDGNIKGEINLGKLVDDEIKERQRKVSNWLYEMGW
jgi:putative ABC transport system ATP-binding protein